MQKRKRVSGFKDKNTGDAKSKRPDEIVDILDLSKDYIQVRVIGDVAVYAMHWIEITTPKGAVINIPRPVPNFDSAIDDFDSTIDDPYKDIPNNMSTRKTYYVNAIVRDDQDDKPKKLATHTKQEKKTGLKSKNSKSWTPVKVLRLPTSVVRMIQKIITMNKHKVDGKIREYELSHPVYGCDIYISFDKDEKGPNMYSVQKGDQCKLTKSEKAYLTWDLTKIVTPLPIEEAKKDAKALSELSTDSDEELEDDFLDGEDDIDRVLESKKKRKDKDKKKKRNKVVDSDRKYKKTKSKKSKIKRSPKPKTKKRRSKERV